MANGYVVTFDGARNVHPGGLAAVGRTRISAVGPSAQTPKAGGFDEVMDAASAIVVPGLINMRQHHRYTLFRELADGFPLEGWMTDIPLSLKLCAEAMRVSSYVADMEMLATGSTCSLNHSVTTTTAETVKASIEPRAEL